MTTWVLDCLPEGTQILQHLLHRCFSGKRRPKSSEMSKFVPDLLMTDAVIIDDFDLQCKADESGRYFSLSFGDSHFFLPQFFQYIVAFIRYGHIWQATDASNFRSSFGPREKYYSFSEWDWRRSQDFGPILLTNEITSDQCKVLTRRKAMASSCRHLEMCFVFSDSKFSISERMIQDDRASQSTSRSHYFALPASSIFALSPSTSLTIAVFF